MSVPLVWEALGAARFGACLFLVALSRWVGLIDIGFLDGSQRRMTLAFDSGDETKGFSVWNTYRLTLFAYAILLFGAFLLLSQFVGIPDLGHGIEWRGLFAAAGAVAAAQYLYQGVSTYFNARRQFPRLAVSNGTQSLLSGVLALTLAVQFRSPEAYLAGFAVGNLSVAAYNLGAIQRQATGQKGARFDREVFVDTLKFGLRLYPTRLATVTSQTFDRIIVTNALGAQALTPYGSAARIPEAASEALPLNQTLMPDLTRAHAKGPDEFAASVDRLSRVALMVGSGLIFVPCAFAWPLLLLWLGDKATPEMAWVMLAIGLYRALETFYSSLALSMIAHGSPQRVLPFTLYNAVALLVLAWPVAVAFGIIGIAVLRVSIHVAQFGPLIAFTRRWIAPQLDLGRWLGRCLGALGLAVGLGSVAVALWRVPSLERAPWISLLLAPVFVAVYFWLVDRAGFAPVPESVKRRARWAFPA